MFVQQKTIWFCHVCWLFSNSLLLITCFSWFSRNKENACQLENQIALHCQYISLLPGSRQYATAVVKDTWKREEKKKRKKKKLSVSLAIRNHWQFSSWGIVHWLDGEELELEVREKTGDFKQLTASPSYWLVWIVCVCIRPKVYQFKPLSVLFFVIQILIVLALFCILSIRIKLNTLCMWTLCFWKKLSVRTYWMICLNIMKRTPPSH